MNVFFKSIHRQRKLYEAEVPSTQSALHPALCHIAWECLGARVNEEDRLLLAARQDIYFVAACTVGFIFSFESAAPRVLLQGQ